ncbi:MAG: helix-turn-helix domain-containing protein [Brasilonema octagenarum HA4186-MV1]|jgi:molybdate-binding protein/DNA-binding XRE family transcriptional regulator|nr:helix-turn-helix domain-containing protein [Brasilonema octagenarum HA4186-MV1]
MKLDMNICNNLKSIRTRLGMSQQDLANLAGVTRQSISGVESGQYAPSVTICLRLAKALGCQVEDLFWLEEDLPKVEAILAKSVPKGQQARVSLARVGDQWIAYPLVGNNAFRIDIIPADGEAVAVGSRRDLRGFPQEELPKGFPSISKPLNPEDKTQNQTSTNKVLVRLLDDIDKLYNTVVIAGCTPVLSLLARATERWHPQLRVHYHFAHSMAALRSLERGEVHIAGMHLYDPQTREHNIPFVREALIGKGAVLITLGVWEEGLLVAPGNPMGIKTVSDLVEFGATIVTHEASSGSRMLLERKLQEERVPLHTVKGFDRIVHNQQDVALSIISGIADAGISTASIAATFGLGFIPLHQSRYDLVILKEYLEEAPVQQFLSILGHRLVRSQLEVLGGYDISKIGEVVADI